MRPLVGRCRLRQRRVHGGGRATERLRTLRFRLTFGATPHFGAHRERMRVSRCVRFGSPCLLKARRRVRPCTHIGANPSRQVNSRRLHARFRVPIMRPITLIRRTQIAGREIVKPEAVNTWSVSALCEQCGAFTVYNHIDHSSGREFGATQRDEPSPPGVKLITVWHLVRCSSCGRGGIAEHLHRAGLPPVLTRFLPRTTARGALPSNVPEGIQSEYREAESCASVEAWRAASALLRSTLEKALKANGYIKGSLADKIYKAADDGVITAARKQRAHDDVRVLGNEVVHDDWRKVAEDEVFASLHYVQRVLEDLYDDRPSVESILRAKGRIPS